MPFAEGCSYIIDGHFFNEKLFKDVIKLFLEMFGETSQLSDSTLNRIMQRIRNDLCGIQ